ncbi:helix-turn-helix transcriptional regulator [Pseudoflavitalea sp. G-6-1-2]|uniref:helix-turn-helix domain-containing protein n=1 Tax=Pseudoflavitalea sp. G-6-1-2 TaxID=2728841 RepID=UPI00146D23CC|nr:AraC family transcriptional regulator [Pseudoflavitalea sp. G-6-1-2]NML22611.1 helix-turn-helix transcriptional regulator [Pseudoflavitalea sp. G-6-1-2]
MYLTSLPDHTDPLFDEVAYFKKFSQQNIIVNAVNTESFCDDHVGCLSIKTVMEGEEFYDVDQRKLILRPGQFLVLNNEQRYGCRIDPGTKVKCLSIFFQRDFAASVLHDAQHNEYNLLDDRGVGSTVPEFFQTLNEVTPALQQHFSTLINELEQFGYDENRVNESMVFLLRQLISSHRSELTRTQQVTAVKAGTRHEIYRRLCMAKDLLHSSYNEQLDLMTISSQAFLSVPQLVRQFKSAFDCTPHQYLIRIRLDHAARLLQQTDIPVQDITWKCGFENLSAFSRAFKSAYGLQPTAYRKQRA